jgi:hypothetical protein
MVVLRADSPSSVLSSLSSDMGLCEIDDDNSLENADTVPDEIGDGSPVLADAEHDSELYEPTVEVDSAVDAVVEEEDDNWGVPTPAKSGKKSKKKRG